MCGGHSDPLTNVRARSPAVRALAQRLREFYLLGGVAVNDEAWKTSELGDGYDYLAPDRSEIRLLLGFARGGIAHCTLPAGATSAPVAHKTVDEVWYFLEGVGQVWRKKGDVEEVANVAAGRCLSIPKRRHFSFATPARSHFGC